MKIEPKAFIAIEQSMATAMHAEWDRLASSVFAQLRDKLEAKDWAGAESLANELTLKGVVAAVRPRLEELALSAVLFGAHRVTGDVKTTTFAKNKTIPKEIGQAIDQLEHAVESDASDYVRKQLHGKIAALKQQDGRAHMQKDDIYSTPSKRPDHQTAPSSSAPRADHNRQHRRPGLQRSSGSRSWRALTPSTLAQGGSGPLTR